jgi:hypothetical protein
MTTRQITSGDEWEYRKGDGALLSPAAYLPCSGEAILLTAPIERASHP